MAGIKLHANSATTELFAPKRFDQSLRGRRRRGERWRKSEFAQRASRLRSAYDRAHAAEGAHELGTLAAHLGALRQTTKAFAGEQHEIVEAPGEKLGSPRIQRRKIVDVENLNERTTNGRRAFIFEKAHQQVDLPAFGNDDLETCEFPRHASRIAPISTAARRNRQPEQAGLFRASEILSTQMMASTHRFCIAPMMDWTDRHCRVLHRALSAHARLYTEMVTAEAVIRGD